MAVYAASISYTITCQFHHFAQLSEVFSFLDHTYTHHALLASVITCSRVGLFDEIHCLELFYQNVGAADH